MEMAVLAAVITEQQMGLLVRPIEVLAAAAELSVLPEDPRPEQVDLVL
jgi:hypothetical protein